MSPGRFRTPGSPMLGKEKHTIMVTRARVSVLFGTVLLSAVLMAAGAYTEETKEKAKSETAKEAQQEAKEEGKQTIPAGQKAFLDNKCNSCHTLDAAKIAKIEIEDEEEEDADSKKEPPDLSSVGKERTAAWIEKWLMKKETIEGQRHRKKFKGSEEELKAVSAWLATFKVEAKKTKGKKS